MFAKFTDKRLCLSFFFNKVVGWKPETFRSSYWRCAVKKVVFKKVHWCFRTSLDQYFPVDTRRRFNVYKTSIRRRRDVLQTFKRRRVSTGLVTFWIFVEVSGLLKENLSSCPTKLVQNQPIHSQILYKVFLDNSKNSQEKACVGASFQ